MVVHVDKVREGNFVVSLRAALNSQEDLVCGLGWGQGKGVLRSRDQFVVSVFKVDSSPPWHGGVIGDFWGKLLGTGY